MYNVKYNQVLIPSRNTSRIARISGRGAQRTPRVHTQRTMATAQTYGAAGVQRERGGRSGRARAKGLGGGRGGAASGRARARPGRVVVVQRR
jgi:hypothetical protein